MVMSKDTDRTDLLTSLEDGRVGSWVVVLWPCGGASCENNSFVLSSLIIREMWSPFATVSRTSKSNFPSPKRADIRSV